MDQNDKFHWRSWLHVEILINNINIQDVLIIWNWFWREYQLIAGANCKKTNIAAPVNVLDMKSVAIWDRKDKGWGRQGQRLICAFDA
jgi:hypothetical protein